MAERWSVRELRRQIERKAFERSVIASAQARSDALVTAP
jgi:predicted nuclease of restriction endonuclease-like (RecB) superfamily